MTGGECEHNLYRKKYFCGKYHGAALKTLRFNTNVNINNELSKISEWLEVNKLSLNTKKTKAMIFQMPEKQATTPKLEID